MRRRKIRKFADREQSSKQTENSSKTEATLILCGSSGEWANYNIPKVYEVYISTYKLIFRHINCSKILIVEKFIQAYREKFNLKLLLSHIMVCYLLKN